MPFKSKAQAAYFNIHRKQLEKQGVNVDEWNSASKGKQLTKRVSKKLPRKKRRNNMATKELGTNIESYRLPVTDTQEARRNFDGYQVEQYFNLADIQAGDTSGTTETDSKTDPKGSGGYTTINKKSGRSQTTAGKVRN